MLIFLRYMKIIQNVIKILPTTYQKKKKKKKKKQNAWKKYECLVKFRITTKFIRTCIGSKTYQFRVNLRNSARFFLYAEIFLVVYLVRFNTNKCHYDVLPLITGNATRSNPPQLHFEHFNIFGGPHITQSNIYDGAFIAKTVNRYVYSQKSFILDARLGSKYASALTLQKFYFFKVFYIIRLWKSVIYIKYFTSFNSSNILLNI